ncbi:hypothetical protein EDB81DRAFT_886485 [Dactylonectria macrodidyma]|uniref:N-acetyltransferase domain-containing protein n=1 Tax=Dactylonectria macrodidyma TaxID=307937 RepID=A0A9P9EFA4_9HYPO|nr:hypothetical protein EDB81DRAFT_886485 [Dactylonectria macrodidyma]
MLYPYADALVADVSVADESPDAGYDSEAKCLHEWALAKRGQRDAQIRTSDELGDARSGGHLNERLCRWLCHLECEEVELGRRVRNRIRNRIRNDIEATKAIMGRMAGRHGFIVEKWIIAGLRFWETFYQRKGQDLKAYAEYIKAEGCLASDCYSSKTVYSLDNLTVDFGFQRRGIGKELVRKGLEEAARLGLLAMTEASTKGEGLHDKLGFEKVAVWDVCGFKLPVMRWSQPTRKQGSR